MIEEPFVLNLGTVKVSSMRAMKRRVVLSSRLGWFVQILHLALLTY